MRSMQDLELIRGNRRADRRYDLELRLRFSYQRSGEVMAGVGRTLDLSRGGVRFLAEMPPPEGAEVELRIEWPFLLQNVCALELVMNGTVLGSDERGTVMQTRDFTFRTCGARSFDQAAPAMSTCCITA